MPVRTEPDFDDDDCDLVDLADTLMIDENMDYEGCLENEPGFDPPHIDSRSSPPKPTVSLLKMLSGESTSHGVRLSSSGLHSPKCATARPEYGFLALCLQRHHIGRVHVKAFLFTLTDRLQFTNGIFQLKGIINDGSAKVPVEFSDQVRSLGSLFILSYHCCS